MNPPSSKKAIIELSSKETNDEEEIHALTSDNILQSIKSFQKNKTASPRIQEKNNNQKFQRKFSDEERILIKEIENDDNDELNKDYEIEKTFNEDNLTFKLETPYYDQEVRELRNKDGFYYFKVTLSIIFSIVYILGFAYNMPNQLIKVGEKEEINSLLIEKANNKNFYYYDNSIKGILISNMNDTFDSLIFNSGNNDNNENNSKKNKLYGYLLQEKIDYNFIFKWLVGLIYFTFRNYLFIKSHNNYSGHFISQYRISILNNLSTFLFPLYLFYYNERYSAPKMYKIKQINDNLAFFIEIQKNKNFFAKFDVIFPMVHFFITSMIFSQFEQTLGRIFLKLKLKGH